LLILFDNNLAIKIIEKKMALFNWNSSYSVNVKEIDLQHQKLVNMINQLHDSMKAGKGKEAMGSILDELVNYTKFHFKYEENLFQKTMYPESITHTRQHQDLVKQVAEFSSQFQKGEKLLTMDLMTFLKKWLMDHIMGTDKKYTVFFNSKGIN